MHDAEQARRALGHVAITSPDASWPEQFAAERERLRLLLGSIADQLQHYGSTAIPGLSAKPIIDMMAPVASLDEADLLGRRLATREYRKIDAGFFRRRFFRREPAGIAPAYHLHLVVCPAWPVKNELLFRDWLIQRPEIARAYEKLKTELAEKYPNDMPGYTDGKTSFLRAAVNDARRSLGLPPETDWNE
jgi:GrpB-like predicted nucleotidyltransferase (UPF0157 family)